MLALAKEQFFLKGDVMNKENDKIQDDSLVSKNTELEQFLANKKKLLEKKKKNAKNSHQVMKDNYYAYHSDIKTSARDNGEW